jgi:hypothetical protein
MAAQQTPFQSCKSIAGAALALLGMFVLYGNLTGACLRLKHALANGSQALGTFPAFVLAVSQAVHSYSFSHQPFSQILFQHLLISSWPLLLVIFGTVLSTESVTDRSKAYPRK